MNTRFFGNVWVAVASGIFVLLVGQSFLLFLTSAPRIGRGAEDETSTFTAVMDIPHPREPNLMLNPTRNESLLPRIMKPVIPRKRPPYESLLCVNNHNKNSAYNDVHQECSNNETLRLSIQENIIDYVIVGFSKCATTSMSAVLGNLGQAPGGDGGCKLSVHALVYESYHNYSYTSTRQYGEMPEDGRINQDILVGSKCPHALEHASIQRLSKYLPTTRLIVGIRHPVLFFQSFYNMLTNNGWKLGDPYGLTKGCTKKDKKTCGNMSCPPWRGDKRGLVCTDRSRHHVSLARLGKTNMTTAEELQWLPTTDYEKEITNWNITNPVFLYETSQLSDANDTRREKFWDDLASFLDYPHKIEYSTTDSHVKPGKKNLEEDVKRKRDKMKIDICEEKFDELRKPLMQHAYATWKWVCQYFVKAESVFVSSRGDFCKTLESWQHDPCGRLVRATNGSYVVVEQETY